MRITHLRVYDLDESITESGLPMSDNPEYSDRRAFKLASCKPSSGHDAFLKGILVRFRLQADHSFWLQFMRYHFADIVSSESKMHGITKMKLKFHPFVTRDNKADLIDMVKIYNTEPDPLIKFRDRYCPLVKTKADIFEAIVMNTPLGLELVASVTTNYLQLKTIYAQRHTHKMSAWKEFCRFIEGLPEAKKLIVGERFKNANI